MKRFFFFISSYIIVVQGTKQEKGKGFKRGDCKKEKNN